MFDSKFIATLFAVAISVIAICNINTNRITSNEGFGFGGLPSTERRIDYIAANSMEDYYDGKTYSLSLADVESLRNKNKNNTNVTTYDSSGLSKTMQDYAQRTYNSSALGQMYQNYGQQQASVQDYGQRTYNGSDLGQTYQNNEQENRTNAFNKGDFYSTANFQANLSPRGNNADVGAYAREAFVSYNQPSRENMATPTINPLGYANYVEGFVQPYSAENSLMKPNYSEGNYNSLGGGDLMVTSDLLPVQNMSSLNGVDKNGQPTQCVFFERIIHSNRNNRRRSQGDPIRGDLPIAPINNGWFNTSANPVDDLQQGAMNVIGGMGSESSKMFADFIQKAGGKTTVGGVDTALMKSVSTNKNMNTVQVSR